jgi:hypothetical protein
VLASIAPSVQAIGVGLPAALCKFPGHGKNSAFGPIVAFPARNPATRLRSRYGETAMVDREQLETLLANRFPGATREQIAAAANAIMAMLRTDGNPAGDVESQGHSLRRTATGWEIRSESRLLL